MLSRLASVPLRCSREYRHLHLRKLHASTRLLGKSIRPFLLADIGEGITECEVLKWSIPANALPVPIEAFAPLLEVQSDKASVEITSPFDGTIKEILVQEGEIAKVGQGLCLIEVEDEVAESNDAVGEPLDAQTKPPSPSGEEAQPQAKSIPKDAVDLVPSPPPTSQRRPHPLDPQHMSSSSSSSSRSSSTQTLAAPSVRHYARSQGIDDLSVIGRGSGKNGRIEREDVVTFLSAKNTSSSSIPTKDAGKPEETKDIEFGRTRWAMYRAMTKSLEIPHFGYSTTLNLTALHNLLPILNAHIPPQYNATPSPSPRYPPAVSPQSIFGTHHTSEPEAYDETKKYTRLTFLPLLIKGLANAMMEWPLFRTSLSAPNAGSSTPSSSGKPTLALRPHADISLALSTPTGLYTPTLQRVNGLSPYEIGGEIARLAELGRRVPLGLTQAEMPPRGGTISVSNVGSIGKGDYASPVLVPGGGIAIVAIGRAKWVSREPQQQFGGTAERRLEVGVSWSADHRVVEGAEMAAFVESWRSWVEEPGRLVGVGR